VLEVPIHSNQFIRTIHLNEQANKKIHPFDSRSIFLLSYANWSFVVVVVQYLAKVWDFVIPIVTLIEIVDSFKTCQYFWMSKIMSLIKW